MKRFTITLLTVVATLAAISASADDGLFTKRLKGNGNKIIENRKSAMFFSEISVSHCIHLVISNRTDGDILVRTDENIMPLVRMEVHSGQFYAWIENASSHNMENVRVDIEMPYNGRIHEIDVAAASSVTIVPLLEADEVELTASGASRIVANVRARSVDVELSGASTAHLTVNTGELDISASGASSAHLNPSTCHSCDLDATGASKINGSLKTDECDCEASGASKLSLKGSTRYAEFEISGASKLSASDFITEVCEVKASGASGAYIYCTNILSAEATGSSKIGYKGACSLNNASKSIFKQQ